MRFAQLFVRSSYARQSVDSLDISFHCLAIVATGNMPTPICPPFGVYRELIDLRTSTPLASVNAGTMGRPVKSEIILSDHSTVKVDTEVGVGGARILLGKPDSNDSKCGNVGDWVMSSEDKKQNRQRFCFLLVLAVGSATLAGCVGKKYGFPGFGAKQASSIETKEQAREEKNVSREKEPSDLNHVASAETKDKTSILPASSSPQKSISEDSSAGVSHVGSGSDTQLKNIVSDVDAAFQDMSAGESGVQKEGAAQDLGDYKKLVSEVENGASSLDALKASLEKLNENSAAPAMQSDQDGETFAQFVSRHQQKSPEVVSEPSLTEEVPGIVKIVDSEPADKSNFSLEFPWFGTSDDSEDRETESASDEKQLSESEPGHIQNMLTKARSLIQENNLLDARIIAETASALKKKTQSVFLPEEITPEQILEEIAMRERQRKEQLLANLDANQKKADSQNESDQLAKPAGKQMAPVVIDLSKDWLNTSKTNGTDSLDDVARFNQSIAMSNQAARLPTITPGGQSFQTQPANSTIEKTSYDSAGNGLYRDAPTLPASKRILLLGKGTGNEPAGGESVSPEVGSSLPPLLTIDAKKDQQQHGIQLMGEAGSAPQLIAPGINSGKADQLNSDFDEFAAGFAEMGIEGSPEIEEAPLLIDEEELRSHSVSSSQISTTMISLIVCGFAFAALMLVRWRR